FSSRSSISRYLYIYVSSYDAKPSERTLRPGSRRAQLPVLSTSTRLLGADDAPTREAKQAQRAAQYLEDGANRSIVEGLSQAYKVLRATPGLSRTSTQTNTGPSSSSSSPYLHALCKLSSGTFVQHSSFAEPATPVVATCMSWQHLPLLCGREIKLQSELGEGHQNIITPEEVVLTSHYLGLVMEFAPGGSLTHYITQKFRECRGVGLLVPEDEARYLFKQVGLSLTSRWPTPGWESAVVWRQRWQALPRVSKRSR
ncbi:protein kinase domain-containing protein, partial [Haematococcus lacustris]